MMTKYRQFGFLVILATVIASWIVVGVKAVKSQPKAKQATIPTTTFEVVDSVWYLSPGELNTLQVDYLYYAKTVSGFKFKTSRLMNIGDTINFPKN